MSEFQFYLLLGTLWLLISYHADTYFEINLYRLMAIICSGAALIYGFR